MCPSDVIVEQEAGDTLVPIAPEATYLLPKFLTQKHQSS